MLPIFWYLLKVIICSGILFGYYWFFLRNKIFHQYNRFYLLASMGLSLALPLLKINFWQPATGKSQAIRVLQAVSVGDEYMNNIVVTAHKSNWSFEQFYTMIYLIVSVVFLIVMIRTLYIIRTLLKNYTVQRVEEVAFVNTNDDSTPFSFLKYIFWNSSIDLDTVTGRQIFKHEVAHIQQKHTYDKLFVNITLIFCWCNPFFWLYRKELNMIHEFIADKKAVEDSDTSAFAAMILQAAYPKHRFELTNNFFYSPIKRRLMMLTKIDNPRVSYFARLMVLPLAVIIFAAFTFKAKTNSHLYHGKKITVVIDAGHGGKDFGAFSTDKEIFEKELALDIAKKVKEINSNDAIEVILTRTDDQYMTPMQKVDFAKANNADLVISFHIDGTPKPSERSGISFWVSKDEYPNSGSSKVLASALINEFNNNYSLPVFSPVNQRERGVWILQANNCPAVLIEAGFITNDKDVAYLKTTAAKETIAKNVLAGIEKYLVGKTELKINTDSVTSVPPIDLASLKPDKLDTFDYYSKYGKAKTYKGQKIKAVFLRSTDNKMIVEFMNGKKLVMTQDEIFKANIISAPPPPPPPPGSYTNNSDSMITIRYDGYIGRSLWKLNNIDIPNNALYFINGKVQPEEVAAKITSSDISDVKVLTPDEGRLIYGEKGKSGVVSIYTKTGYEVSTWQVDTIKLYMNDRTSSDIHKKMLIVLDGKFYADQTLQEVVNETGIEQFNTMVFLSKEKAIVKYGDNGKNGAVIITSKKIKEENNYANAITDLKVVIQEPKIYLGNNAGGKKINLDYLRSLKEITLSPGYTLGNATMFFSGPGFDNNVVQITISSTSLAKAQAIFDRCRNGSTIIFDNIKVIDENGVSQIIKDPPGYIIADKNTEDNDDKIFTQIDKNPEFTGGEDAWRKYLIANLKANTPVDEGWKAGKYTVMLKFIVHSNGTVSDITTDNYKGTKTAQHCIDVIKNAPKWQPAIQNGIKVNAYKKQPITFLIEK